MSLVSRAAMIRLIIRFSASMGGGVSNDCGEEDRRNLMT